MKNIYKEDFVGYGPTQDDQLNQALMPNTKMYLRLQYINYFASLAIYIVISIS